MKGCAVVKKKSSCQCRICRRCGFDPWVGNISWKKKWQPIPYSYLENSMDRVHRVAKTWMWLSNWAGEGNGNPLQYSCLENPVDRGAWWAALHSATQSQTRLKGFSIHACIGEGNGNPLQSSCPENPRDGGAWQLPSRRSHKVGHNRSDLAAAAAGLS